jgi:hypothetical protein
VIPEATPTGVDEAVRQASPVSRTDEAVDAADDLAIDIPLPQTLRTRRRRRSGLQTVVWCGVVATISFSIVGLVLAMCGWFQPLTVIVGTLAVTVATLKWLLPTVAADPPPDRPHWALTAGVVALAIVAGFWNGAHHGEHLIAERDPGVYAATGLWLGDHGNLRIGTPTGPFDGAPGVREAGIGFTPNSAGSLDAQFAHLNAVFLAVASWISPKAMFVVPALVMSAALLLLYALGVRLGKPIGGAAGALALAVSYPYVFVARDTYSEAVALLLLLSGLWALTFVRRSGLRAGAVAGALLGATCMARIDGYIPLMPVAGVVALEFLLARRQRNAERWAGYVAAYVGMVATATLGGFDVWAFSRNYFDSNLGPRLAAMTGGIVAASVVGLVVGRFGFRSDADRVSPRGALRWGFGAIAVAVVAFLCWASYVRPDFDGLHQAMRAKMPTVGLLVWAKTLSYLWLTWYLGPILVAAGFAGLIWMTGRGLFDHDRTWLATAGVGFATTILYLIAPSITPDQPWAIRRFVAVSIPLLLLAAGMGLETLARRRPPWTAIGAGAMGLVMLVVPVQVTRRLADSAPGASLAGRFDRICEIAHREPTAILVTPGQALSYTIPTALQSWCDVPVAGAVDTITPGEIRELSLRWRAEGRRLMILSTSPDGLVGVGGTAVDIPGPVLMGAEYSIDHVPRRLVPDSRIAQSDVGVLPLFLVTVP